jgi:NADP-dependent 3-hydroxy acid dehydrogenase YdfG
VSRTVAIAGAGGALGPHVVRAFREAGWRVSAAERDAGRLEGCSEADDKYAVDLLDPEGARGWAAHVGEVDAVAHLVGGWRGGQKIDEAPAEDYEWLHDLLVHTVQHTTRAFHDQLAASDHGRFVLVSSSQAQHPSGTNASYAATKAAAESWTLALADSFKDTNATANIVVVNAILTPRMREESPEKKFPTFTSADDLADAIRYVVGDSAAKMNGKRLELHP